MNLSGDMTYSATTEKPQGAPASGEILLILLIKDKQNSNKTSSKKNTFFYL